MSVKGFFSLLLFLKKIVFFVREIKQSPKINCDKKKSPHDWTQRIWKIDWIRCFRQLDNVSFNLVLNIELVFNHIEVVAALKVFFSAIVFKSTDLAKWNQRRRKNWLWFMNFHLMWIRQLCAFDCQAKTIFSCSSLSNWRRFCTVS